MIVEYGVNDQLPGDVHQLVLASALRLADAFELPLALMAGDEQVLQWVAAADAEWLDSLR